jgi:hypothetical protein
MEQENRILLCRFCVDCGAISQRLLNEELAYEWNRISLLASG